MKKLFITAAIATMFSVTAFAANGGGKTTITSGEDKISGSVLNQFSAEFRNAKNAAWTVTSNCEKVTFILDGAKMTAFYDLTGTYLGATQAVEFKAIPSASQDAITEKYKGYAVKEVFKYENEGVEADSPEAYFVDMKKTDSEVVLKVTADEKVTVFKTIK